MSQYEITKHTQKLPHKQSFEVMLSCRISDEKLEELTREISREYRIADEKMFFHWWNPSQNRAKEVCWANSSWDGTYEFGTNLMTQEEFLNSKELRPLRENNELGLWFWDQGSSSSYIHLLTCDDKKIEVRRNYLDGDSSSEVIEATGADPLRLPWHEEDFLKLDGNNLTICDDKGVALKFDHIR